MSFANSFANSQSLAVRLQSSSGGRTMSKGKSKQPVSKKTDKPAPKKTKPVKKASGRKR